LAGLSLAILLARQGREVILWEKSSYPFHRVCGEYISKESLPFLKELLPDFNWKSLPEIDTLVLSAPSGNILRQKLTLGGIGISRYRLDAELAEKAKSEGVLIQENCRILNWSENPQGFEVKSTEESWQCKQLFLAHGKGKGPGEISANSPDRRNFVGVKYHIRHAHPANEIRLDNFRNGYCGMSRVEDGVSCLCYLADSAELQASGNDLHEMERRLLSRNPHLQKIFSEADFLWPNPKVISGIRFGEKASIINNAFLLGDAAGSIAPLSGNGMSMALRAAKGLASVLADSKEPLTRKDLYQKFRKQHFSGRIRAGTLIQDFFGNDFITGAALQLLRISPPAVRNKIIESTHGKTF
jgi:flavin-dependent dehydrogenase